MGMMWTRIGWSVEARPLPIIRNSRTRRLTAFQPLRRCLARSDIAQKSFYYNTVRAARRGFGSDWGLAGVERSRRELGRDGVWPKWGFRIDAPTEPRACSSLGAQDGPTLGSWSEPKSDALSGSR